MSTRQGEERKNTPVGKLYSWQIQRLVELGVMRACEDGFTLISQQIQVTKDGKIKNLSIPAKAYNIEYLLAKYDDWEKAYQRMLVVDDDYLPTDEGFSSYSALMREAERLKKTNKNFT